MPYFLEYYPSLIFTALVDFKLIQYIKPSENLQVG